MSLFYRLLVGGLMTLSLIIGGGITVSAVWQEPAGAPPGNNVSAPLNQATKFGSSTAAFPLVGTFQAPNSINFALTSCPAGQTYLSNGTTWACGAAGGSQNLLQVLNNGADASAFTGSTEIGGEVRAGWLHATQPGVNTIAGSLGIGSVNPGSRLEVRANNGDAGIISYVVPGGLAIAGLTGSGETMGYLAYGDYGAYGYGPIGVLGFSAVSGGYGVMGIVTANDGWAGSFRGGQGVYIERDLEIKGEISNITANQVTDATLLIKSTQGVQIQIDANANSNVAAFGIHNANNAQILTVHQNGRVGIGTQSPTAQLEVAGQIKITGGVPGLNKVLTSDINGLASWTTPAVSTGPWTKNLTNVYPTTIADKVGIGTSNPFGNLAIGSDAADGLGSANKGLVFADTLNGTANPWSHAAIYSVGSTGFRGDLVFATDDDGLNNNNPTEKMRIRAGGTVGIGTNTPTSKLHVVANNPNTAIASFMSQGGAGSGMIYVSTDAASGTQNSQIMFVTPNTSKNSFWNVGTWADGGGKFYIHDYTAGPQTNPSNNNGLGQSRLVIDSNGSVGIGHSRTSTIGGNDPTNESASASTKNLAIRFEIIDNLDPSVVDRPVTARITETDLGQNPELQFKYGTGANDHWGAYVRQSDDSFNLWSNNAGAVGDRVTVLQNGNVGIGVVNPTRKLEVANGVMISGSGPSSLTIKSATLAGGTFNWDFINDPNTQQLIFNPSAPSGGQTIIMSRNGDITSNGSLNFSGAKLGNVTNSAREYLQIDSFAGGAAGSPPAVDCNTDAQRGRMIIDHTNFRMYVCNGASRGWDYITMPAN